MALQPYLHFDGNCEEAITFYEGALGARRGMLMRYDDHPGEGCPGMHPNFGRKIMHASLQIGDSEFMLADDCIEHPTFQGFSLSLAVDDEATARRHFAALVETGTVIMPIGPTFFAPCFGMVRDRFGVSWMIIVFAQPA